MESHGLLPERGPRRTAPPHTGGDDIFTDGCSVVSACGADGRPRHYRECIRIDMQVYARNQMLLRTLAITRRSPSRTPAPSGAFRNSVSLTTVPPCTMRGICSRRYREEVHRSHRFGYEFSLLFLDLDAFKRANDEHGHVLWAVSLVQVGYGPPPKSSPGGAPPFAMAVTNSPCYCLKLRKRQLFWWRAA